MYYICTRNGTFTSNTCCIYSLPVDGNIDVSLYRCVVAPYHHPLRYCSIDYGYRNAL